MESEYEGKVRREFVMKKKTDINVLDACSSTREKGRYVVLTMIFTRKFGSPINNFNMPFCSKEVYTNAQVEPPSVPIAFVRDEGNTEIDLDAHGI